MPMLKKSLTKEKKPGKNWLSIADQPVFDRKFDNKHTCTVRSQWSPIILKCISCYTGHVIYCLFHTKLQLFSDFRLVSQRLLLPKNRSCNHQKMTRSLRLLVKPQWIVGDGGTLPYSTNLSLIGHTLSGPIWIQFLVQIQVRPVTQKSRGQPLVSIFNLLF